MVGKFTHFVSLIGTECTMDWQQQSTVKGRWERKRRDRKRQPDNENTLIWDTK